MVGEAVALPPSCVAASGVFGPIASEGARTNPQSSTATCELSYFKKVRSTTFRWRDCALARPRLRLAAGGSKPRRNEAESLAGRWVAGATPGTLQQKMRRGQTLPGLLLAQTERQFRQNLRLGTGRLSVRILDFPINRSVGGRTGKKGPDFQRRGLESPVELDLDLGVEETLVGLHTHGKDASHAQAGLVVEQRLHTNGAVDDVKAI
jgi:hypothetical protein